MNGYHFRLAYGLVGSSNGMVGLGAFPTYVTYAGTAPWGGLRLLMRFSVSEADLYVTGA